MARVDYERTAAYFRRARTLPAPVLARWADAVAPFADRGIRLVADVGAGTGQFVAPLARWFSSFVIAVEPSHAMRAEALPDCSRDQSALVAGEAEGLPLASASCDVVWLSTVVHQFDGPRAAAAECRRVIGPDGLLLVRGFFSDQQVTGALARFPGIERAAEAFPSTADCVDLFTSAGFGVRSVADVVEPWSFDPDTWETRVRAMRLTDSALRPLTDREIEDGIANVRREHDDDDGPLVSPATLRLLVFGT